MSLFARARARFTRDLVGVLPPALLVALARSTARLQPLGVFPGWRFAIEETRPTALVNLRKLIWDRFRDEGLSDPVRVPWYDELVLDLALGNDQSRCLYVSGSFEPNEFAWLDHAIQPGMTILDIGANEGFYTTFLAQRVGSSGAVVAFEPSPRERARLERNVAINGIDNVRIVPKALSDKAGRAVFHVADAEHNGQNTLGSFGHKGVNEVESIEVDVVRLDDVFSEFARVRLDLIKMDVEGAELAVLRGAAELIARDRPLILLEVFDAALRGQGASAADLLDWLRAAHYQLWAFDETSGQLVALNEDPLESGNVVALPKR
jgi:FkbM family methyltransferase